MRIPFLLFIGLLLLSCWSCEEEFTPPVIDAADEIVVEGYIEAGDLPTPPYVLLTRSIPFFSKIGPDQLNDVFVRDAKVTVTSGDKTVELTELCLEDIPLEFRAQIGEFLGIPLDSLGINICAYLDLSGEMFGEIGATYDLKVVAEDKTLTATTTIPQTVELSNFTFLPPPGEPNDTLAELRCFIDDPGGVANYYRYFTGDSQTGFVRPAFSVTDDLLFDGQFFEFPLDKAEPFGASFDPITYGYYRLGNDVTIKWMMLDEAHFNFFNTLEFGRTNQGPFSSYTRIDSNIE
ncbi:MAG: DUF4249 family protein, partial [Bacteroidota bacterium]